MPAAKTIEARLRFDPPANLYRLEFRALGTNCRIAFAADSDAEAARHAIDWTQWVANFESKYSRFLPSSLICEINRQAGKKPVSIDRETERLFDIAADVYASTGGLVDVTALPLLKLWDYRAQPARIPTQCEIDAALELVGWPLIKRSPGAIFLPKAGMQLDIGGIGKEYAVDRVAEQAAALGVSCALIDFGGDIRAIGAPPRFDAWSVGIENPHALDTAPDTVLLANQSVASSGNYRRNFKIDGHLYGHIVSPRTGRPTTTSAQIATVIADTCLKAGILSTASCLLELNAGIEEIEAAYPAQGRIHRDRKTATTKGFHEYVYLKS